MARHLPVGQAIRIRRLPTNARLHCLVCLVLWLLAVFSATKVQRMDNMYRASVILIAVLPNSSYNYKRAIYSSQTSYLTVHKRAT